MALQIRTLLSVPFHENSYVVWRDGSREAVVFDPGLEPDLILEVLRDEDLELAAMLCTHGHADHIGGNEVLKRAFRAAPILIGVNESHLLTDPVANLSALFGEPVTSPPADRVLHQGEVFTVAGLTFEVAEIPGHSPGHIVFTLRGEPVRVFGGDVLFRGSIGRTDFPGGSLATLLGGIRRHLFTLPDDAVIYPGHGPVTTVGHERATNPFLVG